VEITSMTEHQLLEYLRTNSALCRSHAESASDREAAKTLLALADDMQIAARALEDAASPRSEESSFAAARQ